MSKFIALFDKEKQQVEQDLLLRHVAHLKTLRSNGVLFLAGPFDNRKRVIQILESDSLEEARLLACSDPFAKENVFGTCQIFDFIEANEENNYLLT